MLRLRLVHTSAEAAERTFEQTSMVTNQSTTIAPAERTAHVHCTYLLFLSLFVSSFDCSAVLSGMTVVVVKSDEKGNVDMGDLKAKADKHKDNLAALMVTYPSTYGVFEEVSS